MNEGYKSGYADVNGVTLHYVEQGKGPLMILLHGFPEFWYCWRKQIPYLSKKFRVIAPDMRGYNLSSKPKGVSNYKKEKLLGDIAGLIRYFGEEKCILVGHDWGGAIAWDMGIEHPEMLEKLIILNAPHPGKFAREIRHNPAQLKRSWYMFVFQLPWLPEWSLKRDLHTALSKSFIGWSRNKNAFTKEDIDIYVEALSQPGSLTAAINYYRAAGRSILQSIKSKTPKIKVPTRVIWGENDKALGKELTYGLEEYVESRYDIRYISNCSHWVQNEYPDEVNRLIEEFALS